MFRKSVQETALTNQTANDFFTNITGDSYGGDTSFLATVRALVAPRIPAGESIHMICGRSDYDADRVASAGATRIIESLVGSVGYERGQFLIHNLGSRSEGAGDACINVLREKFADVYEGWHEVTKVTEFYRKSFKVVCFVNEELKSAAVFVEQMNLQKWHYLQMATLAILTWYFDPAKGISEDEMKLVQSLSKREPEEYEACIAKIADTYDFETGRLKKLLTGFESRYERIELDRVKNSINSIDRNIENLSRQYADYHKQRNDACIRLLGLERKIEEGGEGSEIMEYFICNRNTLRLESIDGTRMTFAVRTYCDMFDEEVAKRAITKNSNVIYRFYNDKMPKDAVCKLMTALFIDQTLRLKFCAAYTIDLNGCVTAQTHYTFDASFGTHMPNPHIQQFRCMGSYEMHINKMLTNGDYIGAIQQCVASAKSLNFNDSTVMETFMNWIVNGRGDNNKCIELPDGRVVKPYEAVKWLNEQEEQKAEESSAAAETSARED